ncbi:hypothetical protein [Polymorphospora sp. NPDC050346]|uniref:hypothetical protein n=1 Tax=Polymorphospora sp. NPDC050346 TaxID=3155780 RepID=UPI0033E60C13
MIDPFQRRPSPRPHPARSGSLAASVETARQLHDAGASTDALTVLSEALRHADTSIVNPSAAPAAAYYAELLHASGESAAARPWAAYARNCHDHLYGAGHQHTVEATMLLARIAHTLRDPAAWQIHDDLVATLTSVHGADAPQTVAAIADLAQILHRTGHCHTALTRLQTIDTIHRRPRPATEVTIRVCARLGRLLQDCGHLPQAAAHLDQAHDHAARLLGATNDLTRLIAGLADRRPDPQHQPVCEYRRTRPDPPAGVAGPIPEGAW